MVVASQLIVRPSRNITKPPQIIFSKTVVPQQGNKKPCYLTYSFFSFSLYFSQPFHLFLSPYCFFLSPFPLFLSPFPSLSLTSPQQGKKRLVRGRVINGQAFVNTVYEQPGEISVKIYHPLSCTIFLTRLTSQLLEEWYRIEFLKDEKLTELEKQAPIELFRLERRKDLYKVRRVFYA